MKRITKLFILPAMCAALTAAPTMAQDQPIELAGDVKVVKTTTNQAGDTETTYSAPDMVVPGDRLLFSTGFRNTGSQPVENFVVTNPLPTAVRLADDADPDMIVSVDGGKIWGTLGSLTVTLEDGSTRAAQHSDVTHVRWTLAVVAPGESGRVEYPAIIR